MLGRWKFNEPNPITGYTIGFEFGSLLSPEAALQVSSLGATLANDLPRKKEQPAIQFSPPFVMGPSGPQLPRRLIGGVIFDELERDGTVIKQLSVIANTVTYQVTRYNRWREYWPTAERILSLVTKTVLPSTPIASFVLNAVNRFNLTGSQSDIPMDELLRNGCELISPGILTKREPCHSFYGYMVPSADPDGKRIDNINVSVGRMDTEDGQYWADVTINIRVILHSQLMDHEALFGESTDNDSLAARTFRFMHEQNNLLFAKVLKQEICYQIPGLPSP